MLSNRSPHGPGTDASAPRRKRARRAALAAVIASSAIIPLTGATGAQAGAGYFCGDGATGTYIDLTAGESCINPDFHSRNRTLSATRTAGSGTICVGPSSSPTTLSMQQGYACAASNTTVWLGDAAGYAAYWAASGSGSFYGWLEYS